MYNLSNKKMCVYNKKNMCIYVCVWGCLDKYISVALDPQTKIPNSALRARGQSTGCLENQ